MNVTTRSMRMARISGETGGDSLLIKPLGTKDLLRQVEALQSTMPTSRGAATTPHPRHTKTSATQDERPAGPFDSENLFDDAP